MRRSRRLPAAAVHEETRNGPGMNALKCIIIEDQTVRTRAGGSKLSVSAGSFYAIMAGEIVPDEYAAIIGIPCGLIGALFYNGIAFATGLRAEHPWLLYLMPAAGLLIVLIYKVLGQEGTSTDTVIEAAREGERIGNGLLISIFSGTLLTHLTGGSGDGFRAG